MYVHNTPPLYFRFYQKYQAVRKERLLKKKKSPTPSNSPLPREAQATLADTPCADSFGKTENKGTKHNLLSLFARSPKKEKKSDTLKLPSAKGAQATLADAQNPAQIVLRKNLSSRNRRRIDIRQMSEGR